MGQIVKRKKKGRPSKADLARRGSDSPATATESEPRRSLRRRNVRYNIIDYDDYLDEDFEEDEEEEEQRREKKLNLVLKLNQGREIEQTTPPPPRRGRESSVARGRYARKRELGVGGGGEEEDEEEEEMEHEQEEEEDDEDEGEEESERRKIKKRKINGCDEIDDDEDDDHGDADTERRRRKGGSKGEDSVPGTPLDSRTGIPLPEKKTLELILDKLQKKDTYGVYAEPVDPEELPDYHDVIEHPMDFSTVRKKLGNGSYSTLQQFESDVFLICSNAMQYNAPDTIYYKQARSIQELAKKKFEKIRLDMERSHVSEKESKSEQKIRSNGVAKKQVKKPIYRTMQEPVGSDFSSGATLATAGDVQNTSITTHANGCERPNNADVPVEGNATLVENSSEKAEELSSGRALLSKSGRKSFVPDGNRSATYNVANQPVVRSESIFTTFEGEMKQLVAVGLHAEYSYSRSLARFAATLGPVAWKVASQRIEQALPPGCKFGRGWVSEYEPLPTPVLMLENHTQKEPVLFTKLQCTDVQRNDVMRRTLPSSKEHPVIKPIPEGKSSFRPVGGPTSDGTPSFLVSGGIKPRNPVNNFSQQQNLPPRKYAEPEKKVQKQVELNLPPTSSQNNSESTVKQNSGTLEMETSKSRDLLTRNVSPVQPMPQKQLDSYGVGKGGLPNGKVSSSSVNNRMIDPSSGSVLNQMARTGNYYFQGQEQCLTDPVQLMRMMSEKAQKQQKTSNQLAPDASQPMPSVSSLRKDDASSAAAAAARAWMSIGAGGFKQATENSSTSKVQISAESLYNPAREFQPQILRVRGEFPMSIGMQVQSQTERNNFRPQAFVPQPVRVVSEAQFQNRPMAFPQLVTTDFSRLPVQPSWRGLSPQTQIRQKQETLPPDLNIGFQSPGSPVKQQSSGILVDSQQPDLALQL